MATFTRDTHSFAVDEAVTETAFAELFNAPLLYPALYTIRPSSSKQEVIASHGELGDYAKKTEAQAGEQDDLAQQYKKTFVHDSYMKLLQLSRELIDDEDVGFIQDVSMQMGEKAALTMERKGLAPFNDAFAGATYTGEDSLSLCNSAHVNAASGNSQSNTGTNSLTAAGAKTTRLTMRKFKGYRDANETLAMAPNELLVPVDLEEDSWALIESSLKPGGANNDANLFAGRYTVYVSEWLTDTNAWFMMDSRRRARALRWYQRIMLEIMSDGTFSQGTRTIGGYMRFSNGFTDWRWVYGNNPS